jgi:hypothetical protein
MLDSFIISATRYDDLRKRHGSAWDRAKYADAHIFFGDEDGKSYLDAIIEGLK